MTNATASQATRLQTLRILDGRLLRQYQVAAELGLAEHHNYGTHAVLEELIRDELIEFTYIHEINRNGRSSKLAYRNFYLTHKGTQTIRTRRPGMRTRDILRNWANALGF
jgi:transposase-like protein